MLRYQLITCVCVVLITVMALGIGYTQAGDPPAAPQWRKTELEKGYVVFEHTTLENIAPTHVPAPEAIVETVSCALARGEYEPIQIGVHALADGLTNIRVTVVSDLEVTVYHRIDPGIKQQLASDPDGVPRWMASEVYLQRGEVVGGLPEGHSVNFWLLFHADPETSPGVHQGTIRIEPEGRAATELDLAVRVRPFQLAAPRAAFGMYFREDMLPKRFGSFALDDQLALALFRDMAAHGQNSVSFFMAGDYTQLPPRNSRMVEKSLALAREAGLIHPEIPCMALQANICDLARTQMETAKAAVAWLETERRKRGWPEIILYGWDEPPYPAPGLRETYAPLRTLPIRLTTAMNATSAYAYGDLHDVWIVIGGEITPEMQAEARRRGAEVWTYSYRILREGFSPLRQRYYAGLYTWAHRLGGNFVWAYSHGHHSHAWWEPDRNEPMPVTGWEARREGVDDYRYLQMVEDLVTAKTPDPAVIEAGAWLAALRARLTAIDPHKVEAGKPLDIEECDAIRATAADYIQKLGPVADREKPQPVTHLKDEAATFRGKSVKQCVAGLDGADVSQRRAAAWALFELGPQAAEATPSLVALLDDPEVRIPVLRVLEAIGPAAYPAAPKAASLLSHPDDFVRLSATFALAGIARPRTWDDDVKGYAPEDVSPYAHTVVSPLRQALRDLNGQILMAAAFGLFRCGAAAAQVLLDAMKLVESKDGYEREAGLRVLSGMGPAAADAVPLLIEAYAAAEGEDSLVARTLAAIGPAASDAVAVLEQYRTPENRFLADTCYALFCIRGEESELKTMAGLLGDKGRPRGYSEWRDAARFLNALGAEAALVAPLVRDRLPLLDSEPSLRRELELTFFRRVEEGGRPLRLLPR